MKILALTRLKWYDPPQYLVNPIGPCDLETIDRVQRQGFTVVESNVQGWGEHNAIIEDDDYGTYLATLDPSPAGSDQSAPPSAGGRVP